MSKENVFRALEESGGNYISGEKLSEALGVSRAAVWKSIKALREDGYTIDSAPGRGYRLSGSPDTLTEREIRRYLRPTRTVGSRINYFRKVDSTNTYLKSPSDAPDGTVAVTEEQTAGRGRRGRTFESPAGKGVYLSVLLRPKLPAERLLMLTGLCAVAVCNAVERVAGERPQIKWTNDIVLHKKKLAGILTELSFEGESGAVQYAIVGIGINVNPARQEFSRSVAGMVGALSEELKKPVSRPKLAAAMIEEIDRAYAALCSGDISEYLASYRKDCMTLGAQVQLLWKDREERVTALDIDDHFGLVVCHEDGKMETIRTGEVSVRGLYGYVE